MESSSKSARSLLEASTDRFGSSSTPPLESPQKRQRMGMQLEEELVSFPSRIAKEAALVGARRAKRSLDSDSPALLAEGLKRTRISCAPGELRLKNDVAALQRSELVRTGVVGVAPIGVNALAISIGSLRLVATVPAKYPFEAPLLRQLPSGEPVRLALLDDWSAVRSLEEVAVALFQKYQLEQLEQGALRFELAQAGVARPQEWPQRPQTISLAHFLVPQPSVPLLTAPQSPKSAADMSL
ncbi:hypothetical protein M885DRAFT_517849 [Pelagophyceae sp. CCMP2097]|nr:hypothetical protein M885DRAFT_517849 [Pelagophyceae sp. CCMP2097]